MPLQQRKRKAAPIQPKQADDAVRASNECLELIKRFEGFRSKAYVCPAGVLTIGFGSTHGVTPGMTITEEEAEDLLRKQVSVFAAGVKMLIKTPLTQNQLDALTSFAFNLGLGALQRSTLRQKANRGEHNLVPAEFMKWVWAGKTKLPGLIRRRADEAELYAGQTIDEA